MRCYSLWYADLGLAAAMSKFQDRRTGCDLAPARRIDPCRPPTRPTPLASTARRWCR
jgi:hypothetical protein